MTFLLDRFQVIQKTESAFTETTAYCKNVEKINFFKRIDGKWSIAENIRHLTIATNRTTLAVLVPKFVLRIAFGKPNRPSRSYEDVVAEYMAVLEAGGKAAGRYIPSEKDVNKSKDKLIKKWEKANKAYLSRIKYYWEEDELDKYIVEHPMLGKITIRELSYFTIHHTMHHLKAIRQRNREATAIAAAQITNG